MTLELTVRHGKFAHAVQCGNSPKRKKAVATVELLKVFTQVFIKYVCFIPPRFIHNAATGRLVYQNQFGRIISSLGKVMMTHLSIYGHRLYIRTF